MTKTFNLTDEYSSLFTKEEMLAFCQIEIDNPAQPPITGLCKISKPRPGSSSLNYLAVLFLFDTPTREVWQRVNQLMQPMEGRALKACLKDLDYTVASPTINAGPQVFIKQLDCVFKGGFIPGQDYVLNELHPALSSVLGLPLGELVWWEAAIPAKPEEKPASQEKPSLFEELKHLVIGPWRGA